MKLDDLIDVLRGESPVPPRLTLELEITESLAPQLLERLAKLKRLNLLSGDALLSIIAQAPIDPINLAGTLLSAQPVGWTFSAIDFSMVRVLKQNDKHEVTAAIRVDLMDNHVETLVMNRARHLIPFKQLDFTTSSTTILKDIQTAIDEAVFAADREATSL